MNFLPKNMFLQFKKLANLYFLLILSLQVIKPISMSGGQPNILLPLMIVVGVSAIKDLLEDMKRRRADKEENEREVPVLDPEHGFVVRHWHDLQLGSIVKITKN